MSRLIRRQLGRRLRRRTGHDLPPDAGIALMIVIMAILILATLSTLALGVLVVQSPPTQFQRKDNQTLNAAEAGLNVAASALRNATYVLNNKTYGDRALLPCWNGYSGSVGDAGGTTLTYSVTIAYYATTPANQSSSWLAANAMTCTTGIGVGTTPAFALITSAGAGPALPNQPAAEGNRTLRSIYTFSLTNPNLPGGLIKDYNGLCYSGSATAGATVTLQTCLSGAVTQMWAFTTTYLLQLTSTRNADGSGGMCISALPTSASNSPVTAVMKACNASDYSQKFGVNGSDPVHFLAHLLGVYGNTWCLGATTAGSVGSTLVASTSTCGTSAYGVYPTAAVGAGGAGTTAKTVAEIDNQPLQWVNYQEFGRCLDVTGYSVTAASHIVYPCKQDPMKGAVAAASPNWNEVFTWSSLTQYFWVNKDASSGVPSNPLDPAYCMKSPNTNGGYVSFSTLCTSVTAATKAAFTWTVNRDTGVPATSYTIVDSYGRCLSNGPRNPNLGGASAYSSVITATCDGGSGEKWNAPPSTGAPALGNTAEIQNH
jgi:Tfp pilus assembly protein PilX